jgi:hypothetical protein
MICRACVRAADNGLQGWEAHEEYGCKGDCDCQHRTGSPESLFNSNTIQSVGTLSDPKG